MPYNKIIVQLYFVLINSDKKNHAGEIVSAKHMIAVEGMNENDFNSHLESLRSKNKDQLYRESLNGLKKLSRHQQIRAIGWLCVAANADGFMDKDEWQFIYKLYHKELALPLSEIFIIQKELNKRIWDKFSVDNS